jgi:hypothetical protein
MQAYILSDVVKFIVFAEFQGAGDKIGRTGLLPRDGCGPHPPQSVASLLEFEEAMILYRIAIVAYILTVCSVLAIAFRSPSQMLVTVGKPAVSSVGEVIRLTR